MATELGKALTRQGHKVPFITYNQPVRLGSFHPGILPRGGVQVPLFGPSLELVLTSKMVDVADNTTSTCFTCTTPFPMQVLR